MYFENLGEGNETEFPARVLARLLTTELSGAEGLDVVSQQRLYDIAKLLGRPEGVVDTSVATAVARKAGVATMIVGQVGRAGDRLLVTTELVDVATGRSIASQKTEAEGPEDIFMMAEALSQQVRAALRKPNVLLAAEPLASAPTDSIEAYQAFGEAEALLERGDFTGAAEGFEEAVRRDPFFALAYYRLSIASRLASNERRAVEAAEAAVDHLDRLAPPDRDVVKANRYYQRGAYTEAIPLLESALRKNPEHKEALYLLSQVHLHSTAEPDPERAAILMERILALDPAFYRAYDRLVLSYAFQGDLSRARSRMETWRESAPELVGSLEMILNVLDGRPEEALGASQGFSWLQGPLFQTSAAILASQWDFARRLVSEDVEAYGESALQSFALRNRGDLHAYRGEFDDAARAYRDAGSVVHLGHEGLKSGVASSALQSLAELLVLKGDRRAALREAERALSYQPRSPRNLYFAGRHALLAHEYGSGEDRLKELVVAASAGPAGAAAALYRDALRAEVALAAGRAEEARRTIEGLLETRETLLDWGSTYSSAGAAFRDTLVRASLDEGDRSRAATALAGLLASGNERLHHPVLYVQALHTLAKLELERGDSHSGRAHLEAFLSHWDTAGWPLEAVQEARKLLARK
jgi:tetratricopeptide (TPR) repeat protein